MLSALLVLAAVSAPYDTAPDPCASRKAGAAITAVVVSAPRQPRDTVVTATVCVVPSTPTATRVGSYHGELHFDSTAASVLRVLQTAGGIRVENTTIKGQVNFAGAAPDGLPGRSLITVQLKLARPGAQPALRLSMKELNATDGTNLMHHLVIGGTPQ